MTKSLIALAFACVCGMLAVAVPEVAQSQSVTIQGCSNPTFNTQTLVLSCGGGTSAPVCSWAATPPSSYTVGNQLTLTANCSGSPTYAWSATVGSLGTGNCSSSATCTDKQTTATSVNYHLLATNSAGSTTLDAAVNWIPGSGPPTGCAIAPSSQSMGSSGGAIQTMSVSCSGGASLTSWSWARTGNCGGTTQMGTSSTQGDNIPTNTSASSLSCTYTATVGNGSGTAAPTATVTVAGKASSFDCKAAGVVGITGNTMVEDPVPWVSDSGNNGTGSMKGGPMVAHSAYVGVIHVPQTAPQSRTSLGTIDIHEWGGTTYGRWVTLSQKPCDWGQPGDGSYTQYQSHVSYTFTVGPNDNPSSQPQMMPGDTWYVNVRTAKPTNPTGTGGCTTTCDIADEFKKPPGT